jgi:hypothetical protein
MIVTIEMEGTEEMPVHFAQFLANSGPYYEKRYKQSVPRSET